MMHATIAIPRTAPPRERLVRWLGILVPAIILAVVISQLGRLEPGRMIGLAPRAPLFWLLFLAYYMLAPGAEWLIYRRIWRLPAAGILPLLRKQVANEIVLGYAGDADFYVWARRHAGVTGSPFGAVKDVAMLSAVAGNAATLALAVASAPLLSAFLTSALARSFAASVALVVALSLAMFMFRGALFSLPRRDLQAIFKVHAARITLALILTTAMWHMLLPDIGLTGLFSLVTLRMMVSRLPLVPDKDVVFAGLVFALLGQHGDTSAAMALMASLLVAAHVIVGALCGVIGIVSASRPGAA